MDTNKSMSLSFTQILTLIFIVLKLTDVINWSWFWVLSPTLIPLAILAIIIIFAVLIKIIASSNND